MVIALGTLAIARDWLPLPLQLVVSVVMGASFAGLTFVAHEALHGAIVRGRVLRRLVGRLGFLPFAVPPRLWEAWHNRVHHGNTNRPGIDPDTYPTLEEYNGSALLRRVTDWLAPGRSRVAGVFSLLVGFSIQSSHMLLTARSRGFLSRSQHRLALLESAAAWVLLGLLALWLGPARFALAFGVPLLVSNVIIMSLILTNHNLSPQTAVNDPLINSLSVSGPRFIEWLTLGFGFHVEHHLFPAMSGRYAPEVSREMQRRYPARYQHLPYFRALLMLHRSPRVYQTDTVLFDPVGGAVWPTLAPQAERTAAATELPAPPASSGMSASRTGAIALSFSASLACSGLVQRSPSASEPLPPRASESEPAPATHKAPATNPATGADDASAPIDAHHPPPATTALPEERDR
jgi:fatty acid desaturase